MFARYNWKAKKIEPMFAHHAFYPKNMPAENNVWGTKYGRCSFIKCFKKALQGKIYCTRPYELQPLVEGTKKIFVEGDFIKAKPVDSFSELGLDGNNLLRCQSSENLSFIPDKSVDAVITDPPYFDNVMYAELADFYYIWLRLALQDKYEHFKSEYCPRTGEIVVNVTQGKDEQFFVEGLSVVFKECCRVLRDDGLMVFTFHHRKDEAWSSVLKAVLDAGFYIVTVYPVHSEMRTSFHILGKKAICYDTVIVCRKKVEQFSSANWGTLLDKISSYALSIVKQSLPLYKDLKRDDLLVIARGKCLELFSKHYPNIENNGNNVSILEALRAVDAIMNEFLKKNSMVLNAVEPNDATLEKFA